MSRLTVDVNLRGFRNLSFMKPRDERVRREGKFGDTWSPAAREAAAAARKARAHGGRTQPINHAQQAHRALTAQGYEQVDKGEHAHVYEHPVHEGHSVEYHHSGPSKGEWNHSFENTLEGNISTVNSGKGVDSLKKWISSHQHRSDLKNLNNDV